MHNTLQHLVMQMATEARPGGEREVSGCVGKHWHLNNSAWGAWERERQEEEHKI